MSRYSPLAAELWNVYAAEFERRWGLQQDIAAIVGARGKQLFAAEFAEGGTDTYRTSVVLPIRNAFYGASVADERWSELSKMGFDGPVLDYGCGVGFTLLWLKRQNVKELYAYDIPGVQHDIMQRVMDANGIKQWNLEHVQTALCINVLEHVADPCALLDRLYTFSKRVIANICTDFDEKSHVAKRSDLERCRDILDKRGGLFMSRSE